VHHVPPVYEYRCPLPGHPDGCGRAHADELDRAIRELGAETVAAFIAEPVVGATLGAAAPPEEYWPAVRDVCDEHGVLLIADEVMTGFGRTGKWFGLDHWEVRPDILVAGKGAASGHWPLGLCVASGEVYRTVREGGGFVHGFTASHHAVGAAVGRAVLRRLHEDKLVEAAQARGELLLKALHDALDEHPLVGDVRGVGLMAGIELVRDRDTKEPFPREDRFTERLTEAARDRGLLLYPSTGCVDGTNGDLVMLGPPFVISESELAEAVDGLAEALQAVS
jgi:adenosylmethionine-8-amino-7-oxononanoate aminotransferase